MRQSASPANEFSEQMRKHMSRKWRKLKKIIENHQKSIMPALWRRDCFFQFFCFLNTFWKNPPFLKFDFSVRGLGGSFRLKKKRCWEGWRGWGGWERTKKGWCFRVKTRILWMQTCGFFQHPCNKAFIKICTTEAIGPAQVSRSNPCTQACIKVCTT